MTEKEGIMDFANRIINLKLVQIEDIPKIDLYMEQTISFLEQEMGDTLRRNDEAVFTKTMVNNYTKFGILPRPEKKKYNRDHIISLVYIFLLKQILSIQDIKSFFTLLGEERPENEKLETMYAIFSEMVEDVKPDIASTMKKHLDKIDEKFQQNGIEDDKLKIMAFISIMALEANINKMICNQLLDVFVVTDKTKEEKDKEKGQG